MRRGAVGAVFLVAGLFIAGTVGSKGWAGEGNPPSQSNLPTFSRQVNNVVFGEVVVGFFPGVGEVKARQIATQLGATLKKGWIKNGNYRVLKFRSDQQADQSLQQISRNSRQFLMYSAFRNLRMSIPDLVVPKRKPADAQSVQWTQEQVQPFHVTLDESGFLWHLRKIRENFTTLPTAAKRIAILDTGVDYTHPDLVTRVINQGGSALAAGSDCIDFDNDPMDEYGHGTHVAGIAAATAGNAQGVHGVSPTSPVLAVRVLDATGFGSTFSIVCGIEYVINGATAANQTPRRADVINMSLGGEDFRGSGSYLFEQKAVDNAVAAGINVVVAAGNDDNFFLQFNGGFFRTVPADFPNSFTVGCTQEEEGRCYFSNYNADGATAGFFLNSKWDWDRVDHVAPGRRILSTLPGNAYGVESGTSMSAPVVAGAIARLRVQVATCDNVDCPQKRLQSLSPDQDPRNGFPLKQPFGGARTQVGRTDLDAAITGSTRPSVTVFVYDADSHKPLKGVPISGTVLVGTTVTALGCNGVATPSSGVTDGAGTASCLVPPGTAATPSVTITAGSTVNYLGQTKINTVSFSLTPNQQVSRRDTFDFRLAHKRPNPSPFGTACAGSAACDGEITIEAEWRLPEPGYYDFFYNRFDHQPWRPIDCAQARGNEMDSWMILPNGQQINPFLGFTGDLVGEPFVKLIKDSFDNGDFRPSESIVIRDLKEGCYQFLLRQDCLLDGYGAFESLGNSTTGAQAVVRVYRGSPVGVAPTPIKTSIQTSAAVFGAKWWEAFQMCVDDTGALAFSPGNGRILTVDPPSLKK